MTATRLSRKEKQEQTRAAILEAAATLFATRGVEGASMEAVAREAGLTQGAIYSNFANKSELWWAIAEQSSRLIDFEDYLRGVRSLRDELADLGRAVWRVLKEPSRTELLLAQEFDLFLMRNPKEAAKYRRNMRAGRRELAGLLERTAANRKAPLPQPADLLARAIDAATEGLLHMFMLDGGSVDEELCVATLTAFAG